MQQLLREETIHVGLKASSSEEAIKKMVSLLPSWAMSLTQRKKVCSLLNQREKFGTTAIGGGVALPHCVADISVPIASLGLSREGVIFPSLDGSPVHLIYMLLVPEGEDAHPLLRQNLCEAERLFRDSFLKQRLKLAEFSDEAYEVFLRESQMATETLQAS